MSNVINKALKCVDVIRALKYRLNRSALERIYFAFIRSLLRYGCVVWNKARFLITLNNDCDSSDHPVSFIYLVWKVPR